MRLGKIHETLSLHKSKLAISHRNQYGTRNVVVKDLKTLRDSIVILISIPSLANDAREVLNSIPFVSNNDYVNIDAVLFDNFKKSLNALSTKVELLFNTIDKIISKPDKSTLYFKLPKSNDLDSLLKIVKKINDSFNFLLKYCENEDVKIVLKGFDTGSEWLQFGLYGKGVGFVVFCLYTSLKLTQEIYKTMEVFNRYQSSKSKVEREARDEISKSILEDVVNSHVQEIKKKYKIIKDDNESLQRLKHALVNLTEIFSQGGTFELPQSTKNSLRNDENINAEEITEIDKVISHHESELENKRTLHLPISEKSKK